MDPRGTARYAPYIRALKAVDNKDLINWYIHTYPQFQQAYRQLGYPKAYFNDRLIAVINHLLATPDLRKAAALKRVGGHYEYIDPTLESLSVGQKMLLRSGAVNMAIIKSWLRDLRARLTGNYSPAKHPPSLH